VTRRLTGMLAALVFSAVMLPATACTSSGGSPRHAPVASTPTSHHTSLSRQQLLPLFLQCLIEHDVMIWDRAQGDTSLVSVGKKDGWYVNGRVVANDNLYSTADSLEGFYPISSDFKPDQTIATWLDNAASNGTWPKVCAPLS